MFHVEHFSKTAGKVKISKARENNYASGTPRDGDGRDGVVGRFLSAALHA
jgi:hypothetical protein